MRKGKKYSDKQKIAYYKKMAMQKSSLPGPSNFRRSVRGRGDYKVKPGKGYTGGGAYIGAGLGSAIGTAIAPGVGTVLGAPLGAAAGYITDKVFGWGDYTVKKNSLVHGGQPPLFDGPKYFRVRHREYLGDLSSTTSFTNRVYPINPSNQVSFPWLSKMADQYEQYRFNGLIFEFVSTSADALNSTNTALGNVIMATDYDAEDNAYSNQQQMLSALFSNSGKPSSNIMHAIECAPDSLVTRWLYCRSSSISNGPDARLYDLGNFQVATYGSQAAAVIGQLWVTYDVVFQKPQMNNVLGLSLDADHYTLTTPSAVSPFGTSRTLAAGSDLGSIVTASLLSFPPLLSAGTYYISLTCRGASTPLVSPTLNTTNCTALNIFSNGSSGNNSTGGNTASILILEYVVKITAQGATVSFTGGTWPNSPTFGDLWIMQVNGNIET